MSTAKALFGLKPSRMRGGAANSGGMNTYPIASAYAQNIFTGDLVVFSATGDIEVLLSTTDKAVGVFMGVNYEADGVPTWSKYWPTGTSASNIKALVVDDPNATFIIQADASVSAGDLNSQNFNVTLGAGSTVTGRSGFGLEAGTRGTGNNMLRPIAFVDEPGNDKTVATEIAFPKLEVRILRHVDAYISSTPSVN